MEQIKFDNNNKEVSVFKQTPVKKVEQTEEERFAEIQKQVFEHIQESQLDPEGVKKYISELGIKVEQKLDLYGTYIAIVVRNETAQIVEAQQRQKYLGLFNYMIEVSK